MDDIFGVLDVLPGPLRAVQPAFDPVADLQEGAVFLDFRDLALHQGARREALLDVIPRIFTELAQAERDSGRVGIQLDDLDPNVLTHLQDVGHVGDPVPGQLRNMDQAVRSAQVDEGAVGGEARHLALDLVADLELAEELLALPSAIFVEGRFLADDQAVALAVDLEDLDPDPLTDQLLEGGGIGSGNLRRREEATQAEDIDDEPALVLLANLGVEHLAGGLLLLRLDPHRFGAGAPEGEDDVPVFILGLEHEDLDMVAGMQVGSAAGVPSPQLPTGDHAFCF